MTRRLLYMAGHSEDAEYPVTGLKKVRIFQCDGSEDLPGDLSEGDIIFLKAGNKILFYDPSEGLVETKGDQGEPGLTGPQGPQGSPGDVTACWPVGSVFIAVPDTNPSVLLGFGTWQEVQQQVIPAHIWRRTA